MEMTFSPLILSDRFGQEVPPETFALTGMSE